MPQRTNEFQELVTLIQRALAPEGAIVTQSALIETGNQGETREIDVLVETKIGEYRIRIAVEAKDEGRRMDSTKFESIIGKYLVEGGLKVNKIVVVTHHGYYEPVIARAKAIDVDLLTLEEARQIDWSQFRPPSPCFVSAVDICNIRLAPMGDCDEAILRNGRIVCSCGRFYGNVQQFAAHLFWHGVEKDKRDQLIKLDDQAASGQREKRANIRVAFPDVHRFYLVIAEDRRLVESISFDIRFRKREETPVESLLSIHFSSPPHICHVELVPPIEGADPVQVRKEGRVVCSCCDKDHGTIAEWVHERTMVRFLPHNPCAQQLLLGGVRDSPTGNAYLSMTWPFCRRLRVRFKGQDYAVQEVNVQVHAAASAAPLECRQYDMRFPDGRVKRVSRLDATIAGRNLTLLMPDGIESKRISLRMKMAEPKPS